MYPRGQELFPNVFKVLLKMSHRCVLLLNFQKLESMDSNFLGQPWFPLVKQLEEYSGSLNVENYWWGIKFLDKKYLMNWEWSPDLTVIFEDNLIRVKLSGNDHLEPSLTQIQLKELSFLDWTTDESHDCDCLFSDWFLPNESGTIISRGFNIMSSIYGVSDNAVLIGSCPGIDSIIGSSPELRFSPKFGGYCRNSRKALFEDLR